MLFERQRLVQKEYGNMVESESYSVDPSCICSYQHSHSHSHSHRMTPMSVIHGECMLATQLPWPGGGGWVEPPVDPAWAPPIMNPGGNIGIPGNEKPKPGTAGGTPTLFTAGASRSAGPPPPPPLPGAGWFSRSGRRKRSC